MITGNIHELESKARTVFEEHGYTERSACEMLKVIRKIIFLHYEQNKTQLDCGIVDDFIKHQETRFQNGEISRVTRSHYIKYAEYLLQICKTGNITFERRSTLPVLPNEFESVLSDILVDEEHNIKHRKCQHEFSARFFRWLHIRGHSGLSDVDEHIVREYLIECSLKMNGNGLDSERRKLKHLLVFVSPNGILSEAMNKLFRLRIRRDVKISPFMPQDEIAAVLNVIDRTTAIGKRDYAMILLAVVTGLRGVDIYELSFSEIDWSNGEIQLTQEKTNGALALPLTTDVGEAIRDYILNGRPDSSSDKVFLNTKLPFGTVSRGTLNSSLKKYCVAAGLLKQWSSHSLRRSVATNMVISGVAVTTVAQVLGHRSIDATKQYISLDSVNLKKCALDFTGIPVGGVVQ
jgi:site-specific recombinase XerD